MADENLPLKPSGDHAGCDGVLQHTLLESWCVKCGFTSGMDDEDPPFKQELYPAERKSLLLALGEDGEAAHGHDTLENWRALAYELFDCANGEEHYALGYAMCLEKLAAAGLITPNEAMSNSLRARSAYVHETFGKYYIPAEETTS